LTHLLGCIFAGWDLTSDCFGCLLGHKWQCETDGTICGDYTKEVEKYKKIMGD